MKTHRLAVPMAAVLCGLAAALPLQAEAAETSTATVTVVPGALTITAPTDAGNLGTRPHAMGGGTISGPLGQVQVDDARGAPPGSGWVASVTSTEFAPASGPAIPASAVSYAVGTITKVGTATYVADDPTGLTTAVPAVTATEVTGDNSATWNPTITVTIPGGAAAGVYSGTITHSVT